MNLRIYPNPNDGSFVIRFSATEDHRESGSLMNIYDVAGRLIKSKTLISESLDVYMPVDLSIAESGLYFVEIITSQERKVERVLINH